MKGQVGLNGKEIVAKKNINGHQRGMHLVGVDPESEKD